MSRVPNLPTLRALEATVRLGGVARAARELGLTDGAISRAIRELEAEFGFALFERRNRRVIPSPTAQVFASELHSALDQLAGAVARARRRGSADRPLVVSCEPTFLIRWLIPRLGRLQAAIGPGRDLRLVSAGGAVAFARDGIDLAIRRADFPIPDDVHTEPFLRERSGPVCRAGDAAHASDVIEGVLLHTQTRPDAWAKWSKLSGTRLKPVREVRFEHFYQSLQGAVAGAGIAIGPIALVVDDVASGVLVAPWGLVEDGTDYVLMQPRRAGAGDAFDAVLTWLRTEAALISM